MYSLLDIHLWFIEYWERWQHILLKVFANVRLNNFSMISMFFLIALEAHLCMFMLITKKRISMWLFELHSICIKDRNKCLRELRWKCFPIRSHQSKSVQNQLNLGTKSCFRGDIAAVVLYFFCKITMNSLPELKRN